MVLQTNSLQEANEMLSARTRSTIVALIASLSFAAATVAPAVSQAQPDWPALGQAIHCESLTAGRNAYWEKAETAEKEGHYAFAEYYWGEAAPSPVRARTARCRCARRRCHRCDLAIVRGLRGAGLDRLGH